jgi:exodeoxyribonuclease III
LTIVATWNVNSVKARLANLLAWLDGAKPDILCLQEIKCLEAEFPALEVRSRGYYIEALGQRTYNGVAILSKEPGRDVLRGLPGDEADTQARYVEATFGTLRVASIYLPNGNPVDTDKYDYKLAWMRRLKARAQTLLDSEAPCVLAGDYNVAPTDDDVYDPQACAKDAVVQPSARAEFRVLLNLGLVDAYRALHREPHKFTYWDHYGRKWLTDEGLRIDHLLLTPQAADRLADADIDRAPRGRDNPSDHTPIWCELSES